MKKVLCGIGLLMLTVTGASAEQAFAVRMNLQSGGVQGDLKIGGYEGWNKLESISGGFSEGTCNVVQAVKRLDGATPKLVQAAILGQVFDEIEVHFIGATDIGAEEVVLKLRLNSAVIEMTDFATMSLQTAATNDIGDNIVAMLPAEALTISPQTIEVIEGNANSGAMITCGKIK